MPVGREMMNDVLHPGEVAAGHGRGRRRDGRDLVVRRQVDRRLQTDRRRGGALVKERGQRVGEAAEQAAKAIRAGPCRGRGRSRPARRRRRAAARPGTGRPCAGAAASRGTACSDAGAHGPAGRRRRRPRRRRSRSAPGASARSSPPFSIPSKCSRKLCDPRRDSDSPSCSSTRACRRCSRSSRPRP